MRSLIVIVMALFLCSCGDDLTPKEMAVMESNHVNDWHEYYLVNHTTETPQITPEIAVPPTELADLPMCTGWDNSAGEPTLSERTTGYRVGPTSQSAPAPLGPASQLPTGRFSGAGGGGAMKMYTIRGELFHNMGALDMGCVSKKDAKEKAIIAFVKSQ